ncbi:MAG TPA: amidohydrolase family protein, partial [Ornithinibacter sp.]|nr:amidohydrolase family protein [Ornithinibacter sp.]
MSRLRIENATHVVTVDDDDRILTSTTVEIDDGVITEISPGTPGPGTAAGVTTGVTTIDARGKLLMPGLVNLHTHLPMTLLRGLAENLDLDGFLQHLWAAEAAVMDEETVELGATLGALESLLGGCTTQLDMYFHHQATHRGAVAAGSRHVIGPVFFDGPGPDGLAWSERLANLRAWPALLDEIGGPDVPV